MLARKLTVVALLGSFGLAALTGCFFGPMPWSETGNQGGSTPASLGLKLLGITQGTTPITALNPDDLQLMAQLAEDFTGQDLPHVSDQLADAAVQIISANDLQTFQDLIALADTELEDIVIPEGVEEVVLAEVQQLFGDIGDPTVVNGIAGRYAPDI